MRILTSLLLLLVCLACAAPLKNQRVCEESRNVRCMTGLECTYDKERQCEVCHCAAPAYVPIDR